MKPVETIKFDDLDYTCDGYARVLFDQKTAEKALTRNIPNNRGFKRKRDEYVRDMKGGNWLVGTGETIKFTSDGVLIDGQQRLSSVIRAGVPVYLDVKCAVPSEGFKVVDSGAVRTDGDVLKMLKVKNYNTVAAMSRKALLLHDGANSIGTHVGTNVAPTRQDVVAFELRNDEKFQELHRFLTRASSQIKIRGMGVAGWFVAYWLTHEMNAEKADEFFEAVLNGDKYVRQTVAAMCAPSDEGRSQSRDWIVYKYIDAFHGLMMDGDIIIAKNGTEYAKAYKKLFIEYLENMRIRDKMFKWKPEKVA